MSLSACFCQEVSKNDLLLIQDFDIACCSLHTTVLYHIEINVKSNNNSTHSTENIDLVTKDIRYMCKNIIVIYYLSFCVVVALTCKCLCQ